MKRAGFSIALVLALVLSLFGCSLVSVDEEKDKAQVVAEVGGVEVLKDEYIEAFEYYLSMYQMYGYDPTASEEELIAYQDETLDSLIASYVLDYQAKEQGLDQLSAEEQAELDESIANELQYIEEMVADQAGMEAEEDPSIDVAAREAEIYTDFVYSYTGEEMDAAAFEAWLKEEMQKNTIRSKVQERFYESVSVTDAEVQESFDVLLEEDTAYYSESPAFYRADQEMAEMYGGEPIVYAPEGYIRVKHILFAPDTALGEEYTALEEQMAALTTQIGELTLADEVANAPEILECRREYEALEKEAADMRAAHLEASKAEAEAAYQELEDGTDFDAVLEKYTKDSDFLNYETIAEKGKLLGGYDGDDTDWSDAVKEAALALSTPGAYTAIVEDEEGYHILQYVGEEPAGAHPFSMHEEAVREMLLSEKQAEEWAALLDEWCKDESIVKRYPDRIRDVGK